MEERETKRRKKEHDQDSVQEDVNAEKPGLLTLPPELRNTIYELCLKRDKSIKITDCNDTLMSAFWKHLNAIDVETEIAYELVGKKDWSNLMTWCRNVFKDESIDLIKKDDSDEWITVVAAAHDLTKQHDDWVQCERALVTLGTVVRTLDPSWT